MDLSSIRHVDIVVSSLERSLYFYRDLLRPLGWEKESEIKGERGEIIHYFAGPLGNADGAIGLRERGSDKKPLPYDRYDVGLHHLAINAPSRKHVDDCADWLKTNGWEIESEPAEYYDTDYYAVFFYDPDGIKLEVVFSDLNFVESYEKRYSTSR